MKIQDISTKLTVVLLALAAPVAVASFRDRNKTNPSAANQPSANFATFSLGTSQTAQLFVTTPTGEDWQARGQGLVVMGFNVFRPSNVTTSQQASDACAKHHMIEMRSCQVVMGAGEAAAFQVNGDGVSTFQPVVMLASGNIRELRITLEVIEAGRVIAVAPLPAVHGAD